MSNPFADKAIFAEGADWPPKHHAARLGEAAKFEALFKNERDEVLGWVRAIRRTDELDRAFEREFIAYPSAKLAASILSSFLFGENAQITSDTAQPQIDALIEANQLHASNQEGAITCAVEGEIFYKLDWDKEVSDQAIISIVAGSSAFPKFSFGRLVEVSFVRTVLEEEHVIWRHVEHRVKGAIVHRLFKGSATSLGNPADLSEREDTLGFDEVTDDDGKLDTELDHLLVSHVPFWRWSKNPHGLSVFQGTDSLIEGLHRLYTQDQHDAEMAKKRIAVAKNLLDRDSKGRPKFDRSLDLFELNEQAQGAVGSDSKPIHTIDFNDSTIMGERIAQRLDEFLLACGIAPQSAGRDVAGGAESGTARRLAQALTLMTVARAGRYFSAGLAEAVWWGLQVGEKHLGLTVPGDAKDMSVQLQDGVLGDEGETTEMISKARTAQAMSIETSVRRLHGDWTDEQVLAEVKRIEDEQGFNVPGIIGGGNLPEPKEVDEEAK